MSHQRLLLDSFVDVADPAGLDQKAFLRRMVHRCVQLLAVDAATVLLTGDDADSATVGAG